jgi:hypothetical protein
VPCLLRLIASSTSLRLAALGPVLFLNADEAKTTAMFPDDAGSLDALREPPQQLFEAFRIPKFHTHKNSSPPSMRLFLCHLDGHAGRERHNTSRILLIRRGKYTIPTPAPCKYPVKDLRSQANVAGILDVLRDSSDE